MPYTRDQASDFWLEYDERFLLNVSPEIMQAYGIIFGTTGTPDYIWNLWKKARKIGYPQSFVAAVTPLQSGLEVLSRAQLAVIDQHFANDAAALQSACEDFGQGVLYDDRRSTYPPGKVHMMDTSGPTNPPVGYHRWHAIIRATMILGIDTARWGVVHRCVALAWAVQSVARPTQDQHNPEMATAQLVALRSEWMALDADAIDAKFEAYPYPPGPIA